MSREIIRWKDNDNKKEHKKGNRQDLYKYFMYGIIKLPICSIKGGIQKNHILICRKLKEFN